MQLHDKGIVGLYTRIRNKWTYQLITEQLYALYGLGTDVGYNEETPEVQMFLTNYATSLTPEYSIIDTWWRTLQSQLRRANLILKEIENIYYELGRNEVLMNNSIAEAYFFRTWFHRISVTL